MVATAAPGIKDILLLGKVKQLERERAADLIVLDAPAAGHAITFLQSARSLLDTVSVGPINAQARDVLELLDDHRAVPGRAGHPPRGDAGQRGGRDRVLARGPGRRRPRPDRGQRRLPADRRAGRRRGGGRGRGRRGRRVPASRRGRGAGVAAAALPPRPHGPAGRAGGAAGRRSSRCRSCACRSCSAPSSAPPSSTSWPGRCSPRSTHWRGCRSDGPRGRSGRRREVTRRPTDALVDLVAERSIIVCCGSGGVGKTTTAAVRGARGRPAGPQDRRRHHRPRQAPGRRPRPRRA